MKIAVTNHAVARYQQRVPSAEKLDVESVRTIIREMIESAFRDGTVRDHPGDYPDRRMIPFTVGDDELYLALGPNETGFPGDWAVIGVLYDRELGKRSTGATIGDRLSKDQKTKLESTIKEAGKVKYLVRIGDSKEVYEAKNDEDLQELLDRRRPNPEVVEIFERKEYSVKVSYVLEKVPQK